MRNVAVSDMRYVLLDNARQDRWFPDYHGGFDGRKSGLSPRIHQLNKLLDLTHLPVFTESVNAARVLRNDRSTGTREANLSAAERLFAERGMYAGSNRQISEAAGQGDNAAACYHFGTRTDLLRAIEYKHHVPIEELRGQMLVDVASSVELRDWVGTLVRP